MWWSDGGFQSRDSRIAVLVDPLPQGSRESGWWTTGFWKRVEPCADHGLVHCCTPFSGLMSPLDSKEEDAFVIRRGSPWVVVDVDDAYDAAVRAASIFLSSRSVILTNPLPSAVWIDLQDFAMRNGARKTNLFTEVSVAPSALSSFLGTVHVPICVDDDVVA